MTAQHTTPEKTEKPTWAPMVYFHLDPLDQLRADAQAAAQAKKTGIPRGPVTGLPTLDRELGHHLAPGVHGVFGNAGVGKTAFCMQVATTCQFPALYVTCEMAPVELLRRFTARATETYLGRLKSGEFTPDHVTYLAEKAAATAPNFALMDATLAPAPVSEIVKCARVLMERAEASKVLIVIDSYQSWAEASSEGVGEYEILNRAMVGMRKIAHTLNGPVLFISERNRAGNKEATENGGGGLNAGAGTRKIEYGSETIIDLQRAKGAVVDGADEVTITATLLKNRHGDVQREMPLKWHGALQRFREETKGGR